MIINKEFVFLKEEQWINKNSVDISKEFLSKIENNKIKIIEINKNIIKFTFVGVISFKDEIVIVLPKYFDLNYYTELECILKLVKVFKKIPKSVIKQNKEELLLLDSEENYSEISICDYLIKDYIENDYYIRSNVVTKLNNNTGILDWKKTINELNPVFSNGYPIYCDCYYKHINNNEDYFITQIHQAVVEYAIAKYSYILGYKLGKINYDKAKKNLNNLGNSDEIIYAIEMELETSFNDRNINLFKALLIFFKKMQSNENNDLSLYGTTNFNLIWEYLCGYLFKNEYNILSKEISPILWKSKNGKYVINDSNALKPDILKRYENDLLILDAKYYSIKLLDDSVSGNPGSYDIVKQLSYSLAFEDRGYRNIISCLLYPKETGKLFDIFGSVNLDFFKQNQIVNIYISPSLIIDRYIYNSKLSEKEIKKFILDNIKFINEENEVAKKSN